MTLSPCTIEYLKQAKAFLLTDPEFDYTEIVSKYDYKTHCGTCCCLLGWSPAFSQHFKWVHEYVYILDSDGRTIKRELEELLFHHHIKLGIEKKDVTTQHMIEEIERLLQ